MFKKPVSVLLVVSVLSWTVGCSHTHFVTQEPVIGQYDEINKAAKAEDAEFEKVKYEIVEAQGSEYEFAFKYKKGLVKIETVGEKGDEYFEMERPPKEKKKK